MIINAGFGGRDDIFWITHGDATLTPTKLEQVIASGRTIACIYNSYVYYLNYHSYYSGMTAGYQFSTGVRDNIYKQMNYFTLDFYYSNSAWGAPQWGSVQYAYGGLPASLSITYADGTTGTLNYIKGY